MTESTTLEVVIQGRDQFTATANKVSGSLRSLQSEAHKTAFAVGGDIGTGINKAVKNVEKLGVAVGGFLVAQVKFGIDSLTQLEAVTAQTNAVLLSTHKAAGLSADAIINLSNKYEDLNATIDNKVIQSGENLLLTFTNIRKNAFEPALKAALDMNQAMGGGEGGLQSTIIAVGKALQDPIRGIVNLRRIGVNFSEQQQTQIKDLIKHNKLYEAQQVILKELTKEFGGSFAAAGKTATGTFAHLGDAIEDVQASLATALLPAISDVAHELDNFLRDPKTIDAVKAFGTELGRGFKDAVKWAKSLDWNAIGGALKGAVGAAKGIVDAFMHAPSWLQEAVVTGWGLNKLTGGMVTNIFGDVAKGLGNQLLTPGSSPVNPLFVKDVGGIGAPGGLGGAASVGGAGALGALGLLAGSVVGAVLLTRAIQETARDEASRGIRSTAQVNLSGGARLGGAFPTTAQPTTATYQQPFQAVGSGESQMAGWALGHSATLGFRSAADAAKEFAASLRATAQRVEDAWLAAIGGTKGIAARSRAAFGKDPSKEQTLATYQRDILHRADTIVKHGGTSAASLERLKTLMKDSKLATDATKRVLSDDIKTLQRKLGQTKVTVNTNTTLVLDGRKIAKVTSSIAAYGSLAGEGSGHHAGLGGA
jgi:hypothetical protein